MGDHVENGGVKVRDSNMSEGEHKHLNQRDGRWIDIP